MYAYIHLFEQNSLSFSFRSLTKTGLVFLGGVFLICENLKLTHVRIVTSVKDLNEYNRVYLCACSYSNLKIRLDLGLS